LTDLGEGLVRILVFPDNQSGRFAIDRSIWIFQAIKTIKLDYEVNLI